LGQILNDAHASLKSIGVSHPEVDARVEELQHTPGVLGARMMGGGFGGMILVLIEHEDVLPDVPLVQSSQGGFLEELLE
jgi:galactokinase